MLLEISSVFGNGFADELHCHGILCTARILSLSSEARLDASPSDKCVYKASATRPCGVSALSHSVSGTSASADAATGFLPTHLFRVSEEAITCCTFGVMFCKLFCSLVGCAAHLQKGVLSMMISLSRHGDLHPSSVVLA